MIDAVELAVDGTIYGGWREFAFSRRIDDCAALLSLKVTEKWAGVDARRPVRPGAAYSLSLGGTERVAGYIDGIAVEYDPDNHTVNIETRCAMADIIDCAAAVDGPHEFRNLTLTALAQKLCEPYGLTVRAECDAGAPFGRFAIQPGETAWAATRGARLWRRAPRTRNHAGGSFRFCGGLASPGRQREIRLWPLQPGGAL